MGRDSGSRQRDGRNDRNDRRRDNDKDDDDVTEIVTRTADGSGTNEDNEDWGATHQELLRLVDAVYADDIGEMVDDRPNARVISNEIFQQFEDEPNSSGISDLFWAWGQFIDHDLSLTEGGETEYAPVIAPADDPAFVEGAQIVFNRVDPVDGTGEGDTVRAYENEITSFIDASMVYGSNDDTAAALRDGAYMLIGDDGLLPSDGAGGVLAGDVRAAENVALTSMHTLFVLEHNRLVEDLAEENPSFTEDELFDLARMHVEAKIQAITYNEWLPILVGEDTISDYEGYDETVNPGISVEFSTAVFRVGHTLLSSDLQRLNEDGSSVSAGALTLQQAFFNPTALQDDGGIDALIRGLAGDTAQELDTQVVEDVRSFLFAPSGEVGLDLVSLNIQRGRDLGVADYNTLREGLGLEPADSFSDVTSDPELAAKLEEVYGDISLLDAYVGGLAEDAVNGGLVGELFSTVIVDQFTRVRDGDPLWSQAEGGLSEDDADALWETTLADIIEANTGIFNIQEDAFYAYERIGGTDADDTLTGTDESDLILGGAGDDIIDGGAGDDEIEGGAGDDVLTGGEGENTFIFDMDSGEDIVTDLTDGDIVIIDVDNPNADLDIDRNRRDDTVTIDLGDGNSITFEDVSRSDVEDALVLV